MMLCFGMIVGTVILLTEHFVFKYILPSLRMKSKDCFWKSPNLMFFSQVSYHLILITFTCSLCFEQSV
jgi:hypothetical protein